MEKLYVSTTGNDGSIGSHESPLASLEAAVERSRELGIKNIEIISGSYFGVSVTFTKKDSGLSITAEKGTVTLYGGFLITKWISDNGMLHTQIYENCKEHHWYKKCVFRVLEVNGRLRMRSRLPKTGMYRHLSEWKQQCLPACQGHWDPKPTAAQRTTLKYDRNDLGTWLDTDSAELLIYHEWSATLAGLIGMDDKKGILYLTNPTDMPPGAFADRNDKADKYIVYNVKEGMTDPGQWFFDNRNSELWYRPLPNEKLDDIHAVFAVNESVLIFENTHDININGIDIAVSNAPLMDPGYGARALPGAVRVDGCENIAFDNMCIRNTTAWGMVITRGSEHISVINCTFRDLGAGAVNFFGNEHGSDITINGCQLYDMGYIYPGAVGIYGNGISNTVSHCEIHDTPYCAINDVGGYSVVDNTLIWNIKEEMQDGGAIYLCFQNNVLLRNNVVFNDRTRMVQSMSYYFDELCTGCIAENNLSVNGIVPSQNHIANNCTSRNNIYIENGLMKIRYVDCSDLHYIGNVLIADEIIFYGPANSGYVIPDDLPDTIKEAIAQYAHSTGITVFLNNIVYSKKKPPVFKPQYGKGEPEIYMPGNNIYGDPGFKDIDNGVFTAETGSNAQKAGFPDLSFSDVGCTGRFYELFKRFWPLEPNYIYGWAPEKKHVENT